MFEIIFKTPESYVINEICEIYGIYENLGFFEIYCHRGELSEHKVAYHCFTPKYSGKDISFSSVFVFVCCNYESKL